MVPLPHQTMGDTGGPGIKSFFIFNIIIDKRWFYVNNVCLCVCVCVCVCMFGYPYLNPKHGGL
jgi:hypothetical protein